MARPSQPKKSSQRSAKRKDDISSLKTEVLKLRLQALNLPITGSRADLIAALQNATSSGSRTRSSAPQASSKATGRVSKRSKGSKAATSRTKSKQTVTAAKHREQNPESSSDTESEASSRHHESDEDDLSDANLSADDLLKSSGRAGGLNTGSNALTAEHLQSVIQETVESTVHAALAQQNQLYGRSSVAARTANPLSPYRAPGAATPLGLNRPLDRNLEDRILRGEYVDFTLLLPDSISQSQVPDLQFRLADSSPGPLGSPITMVRKRKPTIDSFQKWIDAFTAYMVVIVSSYRRRSVELLKYQQIISLAATKFRGSAWLSYDEQFRRRAAHDLTRSWDQIDLELWAITFSGLAKPHCSHCSSPHHLQGDCPLADQSRHSQSRRGINSYCYDFNRPSGCSRRPNCLFPHVCSRCSSSSHSFHACPQRSNNSGARNSANGDRPKK